MTDNQSSLTNRNKIGYEDFINKLQRSIGVNDIHPILCKLIVGFISILSSYINDQINVSSSLYGRGFRIPPNNLSIYIVKLHSYRSLLMIVACFLYYIINLMIIDFCPKNFVHIVQYSFSLFFIYLLIISRFMLFFFSFFTPSISLRIYYILIIEGAFSGFFQMSVILLVPQYSSIIVISKDILALLFFLIQLFYDFVLSHKPLIMIRIQFFVSVFLTIIGFGLWAFYLLYYNKKEPESHKEKIYDFDLLDNINKTIKNKETGYDAIKPFLDKISDKINSIDLSESNRDNIINELKENIEEVPSLNFKFKTLENYVMGQNCIDEFIEKLKVITIYTKDLIDSFIKVKNKLFKNVVIDDVLDNLFQKFNQKNNVNNFISKTFEEIKKDKIIDLGICKLFDDTKKEYYNQDDKTLFKKFLEKLKSKKYSKKSLLELLIQLKKKFYKNIITKFEDYNTIDQILSIINSHLSLFSKFEDNFSNKNLIIYLTKTINSINNIIILRKYDSVKDQIKLLLKKLLDEENNIDKNEPIVQSGFVKLSESFNKLNIIRSDIDNLKSLEIIRNDIQYLKKYNERLKKPEEEHLFTTSRITLDSTVEKIDELISKYNITISNCVKTLESIKLILAELLNKLKEIKENNDKLEKSIKDLKSSYSIINETDEKIKNLLFFKFTKALYPFLMIIPTCFFKDFLYPSILPFALLIGSESHYINIATNIFHIVFCLAIFFLYLYSHDYMDYVWKYFDCLWLISIIPFTILIITLLAIHTKIGVFHRITLSLRKVFVLSLFFVSSFTVMESISYVCVADYVYNRSQYPAHNLKYLLYHHLLALTCSYIFSKLSVGYNHTRIELGHVAPYYQTELDLTNLQVFWFLIKGTFKSTFRDILFLARTDIREYL